MYHCLSMRVGAAEPSWGPTVKWNKAQLKGLDCICSGVRFVKVALPYHKCHVLCLTNVHTGTCPRFGIRAHTAGASEGIELFEVEYPKHWLFVRFIECCPIHHKHKSLAITGTDNGCDERYVHLSWNGCPCAHECFTVMFTRHKKYAFSTEHAYFDIVFLMLITCWSAQYMNSWMCLGLPAFKQSCV